MASVGAMDSKVEYIENTSFLSGSPEIGEEKGVLEAMGMKYRGPGEGFLFEKLKFSYIVYLIHKSFSTPSYYLQPPPYISAQASQH